jgi:hypothetical protein
MIPTDDKVRAMVQRAFRALEKDSTLRLLDPDAARRALRKAVETELAILETIDQHARDKISHLARHVAEGTKEWDELFFRYVNEERRRRGL